MSNIVQSKGNQTVKLGQLIEYILTEMFFFENYTESTAGRLVPDLFLLFEKASNEVKASGLPFSFNIFR